jgi:hypothetical protein
MKWELMLLLAIAVEAIWILSSAFRSSAEEKKAQGRTGNKSPGRARSDRLDAERFLEEINRRRRAASERQPPPRPNVPQPPRRVTTAGEQPRRRASEIGATAPALRKQQRGSPARVEAPGRRGPSQAREPAEVLAVEVQTVEQVIEASPGALGERGFELSTPATLRRTASPVVAQFLSLVRSRRAFPMAVLLREVFGPPRCRSPHVGPGAPRAGARPAEDDSAV